MPSGPGELVVIGGGPLAGAALLALGTGAAPLVLVDDARVEEDEADRHPLLRREDVGAARGQAARRRLAEVHPSVRVEVRGDLPPLSCAAAVLDCSADPTLALAAEEAALAAGVPVVHAAWRRGAGHLLTVQPGLTACLGCLFEGVTIAAAAAPDGLAFTLAWALGGLAGAELERLVAGEGGLYAGRLLALDATGTSRAIAVRRRSGCLRCAGARRREPPLPPPEAP